MSNQFTTKKKSLLILSQVYISYKFKHHFETKAMHNLTFPQAFSLGWLNVNIYMASHKTYPWNVSKHVMEITICTSKEWHMKLLQVTSHCLYSCWRNPCFVVYLQLKQARFPIIFIIFSKRLPHDKVHNISTFQSNHFEVVYPHWHPLPAATTSIINHHMKWNYT